jgi:TolB-like protein
MKTTIHLALALTSLAALARGQDKPELEQPVVPAAVLAFQERGEGVRGYGNKVGDILFAKLSTKPDLYLVEREDMDKILKEHELNLSGAVSPGQATQVGQLTGAKILITGSVIEADRTLYLVAKIIGTETSRVLGESVQGKAGDDIGPLTEQLAEKVAGVVANQSGKLVAKVVRMEDRMAALKAKLGAAAKPTLTVRIAERHVGQATIDPAAETEVGLFAREAGFELLDAASGKRADVDLVGEGFSEFALRRGGLVSVKARVELKAIDRATGNVIATDRQTAVVVDLTELVAGKAALQAAAAQLAERMLPKLVK